VKTFLVVDDEPSLLILVKAIIERSRDKAVLAKSGFEALQLAGSGMEIDAVITDIRMPEMDGFAFSHEVRKIKPMIPILFMSGFPGQHIEDGITQLLKGKTQYIPKPFTPAQLLQSLQTLVV
jgi:two-component system cell cycle sensor histidine kinase/response regulator CckA